jgi:hypothetical protein
LDVLCCWFDFQHHWMLVGLCDEPLIHESIDIVTCAIRPDDDTSYFGTSDKVDRR